MGTLQPQVSRSRRPPRPARGRMIRVRDMSKFLRDHLGKTQIRHREDERRRLAMLNRINANLNMISRWVNTHKSAADAVQVMVYLADVQRELGRVLEAMDQP